MLTIRDLLGNEEALTDFKELTINRRVNGEKQLSLTLLPTKNNEHSFPMAEEESILTFNNEEYVIKKVSERSIGNTYIKRVDAIHKFYVDMINKQQPNIHNGSMTFSNYLSFVFDGTGYTFSIIDTFYAKDFENLGNDNRLALLQKGLERYKAEMEIVGTNIRFRNKVGNDTDFQFRYGHNIKSIEKNVDTTNLATVIRGTGAEGISAYYRSPNADIFGEIDAPSVNDERFTTQESLLDEMKSRLEDTPEFSITIDFVDLRAAGYPYTVPNEGDRVHVIYEPMNDLLIENRIMEIREVYNAKFEIIKSDVTLANHKKTFAGTMFDNVNKRLSDLVNSDGVIRYNVLDEAVKIATEALKSAQTELEFTNGIIARDKNNPNLLVLFNSMGLGISTDGGNTFRQAITPQGVVTDLLTAGQINANNVSVRGGTADSYSLIDANGFYSKKGAMVVERPDGYKAINNGILQNEFGVIGHDPPYREVGIDIVSVWWNSRITQHKVCQSYYFKHDSRFLKVIVGMYSVTGESIGFEIVGWNGNVLAQRITNHNDPSTGIGYYGEVLTVDLGVPTGNTMGIYARLWTGSSGSDARARIIGIYKEG